MRRRDTFTVKIPAELADRLAAEADILGIPLPWLIARILRQNLDRLPERLGLTDQDPP